MEIKAKLKWARITPRKLRLVGDLCRGMSIEQAHYQLQASQKKGAKIVSTLIDSAVANAKEKGGFDMDHLYVKQVEVTDGPMLKRFMPRAQGRATKIRKKMSHLTVVLGEAR